MIKFHSYHDVMMMIPNDYSDDGNNDVDDDKTISVLRFQLRIY